MQTVCKYDNAITYTNMIAIIENFIISKEINYICMTLSQNKFVLSNLPIAVNDKWFLNSGIFTYFTLFEFNFVDITLDNYGQVETANLKISLFIVTSGTVLIEHEIFNPEKGTTKVAVSKLSQNELLTYL